MGNRRQARECALQILYPADLASVPPGDGESLFWEDQEEQSPPAEVVEFTHRIVRGVWENRRRIDGIIEQFSVNWKMSRMPCVDRNVLRIGVYEFLHCPDIPVMVTINEAIELGKAYSTKESGAFINGILDRIARQVEFKKTDNRRPSGG